MKIPLTPTGIEPATFRFVAQHLNHCATADRNGYQKYFLGGKGGRYVGLTTFPLSCVSCLETGNLKLLELSGPVQVCNGVALPFYFVFTLKPVEEKLIIQNSVLTRDVIQPYRGRTEYAASWLRTPQNSQTSEDVLHLLWNRNVQYGKINNHWAMPIRRTNPVRTLTRLLSSLLGIPAFVKFSQFILCIRRFRQNFVFTSHLSNAGCMSSPSHPLIVSARKFYFIS